MFRQIIKERLRDAGYELRRRTSERSLDQLSVALDPKMAPLSYAQIGTFLDEDGIEHPVYDGYRYSIKQGWRAIPPLRGLQRVCEQGGLTAQQEERFREIAGTRTIAASLQDIRAFVEPILSDRAEMFEENDIEICAPRLADAEYGQEIEKSAAQIRQDLASTPGLADATGLRVLDVGCGRGFSTAAFRPRLLSGWGMTRWVWTTITTTITGQ